MTKKKYGFNPISFLWQSIIPIKGRKGWSLTFLEDIKDGDTVTLRPLFGDSESCRLHGIDTPETSSRYEKQPYGKEATGELRKILRNPLNFGIVFLYSDGTLTYGRVVGRLAAILCWDVNLRMVRIGAAWSTPEYLIGQREVQLELVQDAAKKAKRGLWGQRSPVEPKKWRKTRKRSKVKA